MDARLPAHIEVSGLIRAAETCGGFGVVVQKGERDAGTLLVVTTRRGAEATLWERLPRADGTRAFTPTRTQGGEDLREFDAYLARRKQQDSDCWVVELDVPDPGEFAALQDSWTSPELRG